MRHLILTLALFVGAIGGLSAAPNDIETFLDTTVRRNLTTKNLTVTGTFSISGSLANTEIRSGRYMKSLDETANAIPFRINTSNTAGFGQGTAGNPALMRGSAPQVEAANGETYVGTELLVDKGGTGTESWIGFSGAVVGNNASTKLDMTGNSLVVKVAGSPALPSSVEALVATSATLEIPGSIHLDKGGTGTGAVIFFSGPADTSESSWLDGAGNRLTVELAGDPGSPGSVTALTVTSTSMSTVADVSVGDDLTVTGDADFSSSVAVKFGSNVPTMVTSKTIWIPASDFALPSANPAAVSEQGSGYTLAFADAATDDFAWYTWGIPDDFDKTGSFIFVKPVYNIPSGTVEEGKWDLAYASYADGGADSAPAGEVTTLDTPSGNDKWDVSAELQLPKAAVGASTKLIDLYLSHDVANAFGGTVHLKGVLLTYTTSKNY